MKNNKKPVELTADQLNTLVCYILMTTNYREREREAWKSLAQETDENGQIKFKNAQSNYEYFTNLETELTEIRKILDKAY